MPNSFLNPASKIKTAPLTQSPGTKIKSYLVTPANIQSYESLVSGYQSIVYREYANTIAVIDPGDPLQISGKNQGWSLIISTVTSPGGQEIVTGGMKLDNHSYIMQALNWAETIRPNYDEYHKYWKNHLNKPSTNIESEAIIRTELTALTKITYHAFPTPFSKEEVGFLLENLSCEAARFASLHRSPILKNSDIFSSFQQSAALIGEGMKAIQSQCLTFLTSPVMAVAYQKYLNRIGKWCYQAYPVMPEHINRNRIAPVLEKYYDTPRIWLLCIPQWAESPEIYNILSKNLQNT